MLAVGINSDNGVIPFFSRNRCTGEDGSPFALIRREAVGQAVESPDVLQASVRAAVINNQDIKTGV